jgi:adenylylsulfate kinase-like enzyme
MADRQDPDQAWRCVLLSGPAGSGKTTVCRLGYRAMAAAWGHPAAAIDTDQVYFNVDARWELAYDDARNAMVLAQAGQLAISLFEHGWRTVIICGNSLFDPVDTAPGPGPACRRGGTAGR